jgi:hypothetical protein
MNKIRLIFLILVFGITVVCLLFFHQFRTPIKSEIEKTAEFKITNISGNGKVYLHNKPIQIEGKIFSALSPVNIKQMQYSGPMYLKSDDHTAFEFYCFDTSFAVLPDSYLFYHPETKELHFYTGEFYWNKKVKRTGTGKSKNAAISLREPENVLTLSNTGRVKIKDDKTEIWNYSGDMQLNYEGENFRIAAHRLFVSGPPPISRSQRSPVQNETPKIIAVLPMPRNIDPARTDITLKTPDDSVVRFNWSPVEGNPQYKFRLYSSNLRENILVERYLDINRLNIELLQFEERKFYWEVFPLDPVSQQEGVPSKMGEIKLVGYLLGKKNVQKPPELEIKALTVNGNLVIIKGKADANCQLFINEEGVKVDTNGEFIYTLSFKTIGPKKIVFKLVSPLGIETTEERNVTIYEE